MQNVSFVNHYFVNTVMYIRSEADQVGGGGGAG